MLRLILARHGVTDWNAEGRYQGHLDIPLNAMGRRQAEALATRLADVALDAIYASDLGRAWETAAIINAQHDLPLRPTPRLREMGYGVFAGLNFDQMRAQYPQEFAAWQADRSVTPPEGESLADFAARVQACFTAICAAHHDETLLIVGHGGPLRQIICLALDLPADRRWNLSMDNASLSELHMHEDGGVLFTLNDTHHLTEVSLGSQAMSSA